ncbi:hypothetical protein [Streptomyces flavofungini]|uniref:hypothetical protein n=1 Tax=Streptomyces flavofungini TaxID=68200 RepID=UPI0025AF575F|nr:hypothetical protein [Streptomyces flavofungini]WJV44637.1 hypothetical protein QUY26_03295 [Streptomyces flavofungini]
MTIEVWDRPVPVPPGAREESELTEIRRTSGKLQARGLTSGAWPAPVRLPGRPETWTVRAVCGGRTEVAARSRDRAVEGVEQYLLQL